MGFITGILIGAVIGAVIGAGGMFFVYRNNKKLFEEKEAELLKRAEVLREQAKREIEDLKKKIK